MSTYRHVLTITGLLAVGALSLSASRPAAAQIFTTDVLIANGLDNPRGLAFGPDGGLYIAEAGRGGNGASIVAPNGQTVSFGASGGVTRYLNGSSQRVLSNLPSLAVASGANAVGLHDIVFDSGGQAFGIIGLQANPSARNTLTVGGAPGNNFGQLVRLTVDGSNTPQTNIADVSAFEAANNPDGTTVDSNPYGLVARTGGGFAVADAGANALLGVTGAGSVSLLATFAPGTTPNPPPPTFQAVPTSVALAANGDFFVGQLTGAPFPIGGANIYRVPSAGGTPTVVASGFTTIIDMITGTDGNIYVLQLTSNGVGANPGPGQLIRVDPLTGAKTLMLSSPLLSPGGVAQGADGAFYVTNMGTSAGGGQLIRVNVINSPEPGTLGLLALVGLPVAGVFVRRRAKRPTE